MGNAEDLESCLVLHKNIDQLLILSLFSASRGNSDTVHDQISQSTITIRTLIFTKEIKNKLEYFLLKADLTK